MGLCRARSLAPHDRLGQHTPRHAVYDHEISISLPLAWFLRLLGGHRPRDHGEIRNTRPPCSLSLSRSTSVFWLRRSQQQELEHTPARGEYIADSLSPFRRR
jgi:hypothetical protein